MMLKIGLIGVGFMGRSHLEQYLRLQQEGMPIEITAVCDADPNKLQGGGGGGNIETTSSAIDFSRFRTYTDMTEMLAKEQLDFVDITLPTFLHRDAAVQCLNAGLHVLCEKPMARNTQECADMIRAAEKAGKQLMIGQCLRFWPAYVYLKQAVEQGTYGKAQSGYFYRGGGTPTWGAWLINKELSGGALLDMHVHDTDVIHWLFGKPAEVSCVARNVVPGSGYDIVSTHYAYDNGIVLNAQADWTLGGDYGFEMTYRVNFERGNFVFQGNKVKVNPNDGPGFEPDLSPEMGYYCELKYFIETLLDGRTVQEAKPVETKDTISIIEAEIRSADERGKWITV